MSIEEGIHSDGNRLARLERSVRRQRSILTLALAATACLFASGFTAPAPDVVTARRFVLVDESGSTRATLETADSGVSLQLMDLDGTARVGLGTGVDATGWLHFRNGKGEPRMMLGQGGMTLLDDGL